MFDYVLKNSKGEICKIGDIILLAGQHYLVARDTYQYDSPEFRGSKSVVLVECTVSMSGEVTVSTVTKLVAKSTENWIPCKGYNFFPILEYLESCIHLLEQHLETTKNNVGVEFITEDDIYLSICSCILAIHHAHAKYVQVLGSSNPSSSEVWQNMRTGTNILLDEGEGKHLFKVMADGRTEHDSEYLGGPVVLAPLEEVNGRLTIYSSPEHRRKYYFNVNHKLTFL